ncbi:MAG: anthranilate synthase component I [Neisseriaceae bacterium]|nr:anthranilate synthase component I [Neisseriaceae bacterium]
MISLTEYQQQVAQGYTHIPLVYELLADMDTPLSLYLKLANQPFSYLLESVVGGERFGRYSFIGLSCDTYLKVFDRRIEIYERNQLTQTLEDQNPLDFIENFQAAFKTPEIQGLPRFTGGLVGYFSYETVHYVESKLGKKQRPKLIDVPDIFLMLSQSLAVLDNLSGKIYLIVYADAKASDGYQKARQQLEDLRLKLRQSPVLPLSFGSEEGEVIAEVNQEQYKAYVRRIREYILDGDCMQVVPSQRFYTSFKDNPLSLYRALRTLNPSPYLIYYNFGDFYVVGSSPEILVRREKDQVTVRPIAGTRKRGRTPEEDLANEKDLLSDEKEIVEHTMLIDLGRNDVGKISQIGQVKVTDKMVIERYSHVMHIVSNVEGILKPNMSNMQVLAATLPAGTLSGAPKIRAMEIIEELEPTRRGIYGGAIGYLSFNGDMDLAIAIRTAVIKDETVYIQSGGGIVADSNEEAEWQETQNKAMAVVKAVRMVQKGLDQ